jgi:hypothetical protein
VEEPAPTQEPGEEAAPPVEEPAPTQEPGEEVQAGAGEETTTGDAPTAEVEETEKEKTDEA